MNVICDTNVWYHIGNGKLKLEDIEGLPIDDLCVTYTNIIEILYSNSNFKSYKNALHAIKKYAKRFIDNDPFQEVRSRMDDKYIVNNNLENILDKALLETERQRTQNQNTYSEYYKAHLEIKSKFLKSFESRRKEIESNFTQNDEKQRRREKKEYFVKCKKESGRLIYEEVNELVSLLNDIQGDFVFKDLEFDDYAIFINLFKNYLIVSQFFLVKLVSNEKMKIDSNDLYDLTNMLYIGKLDLYLHGEKRWKNIFNDIGFSPQKYIYTLDYIVN
ncbi:hypothetical protein ACE193_12960 [Bernardetia sp. OM2101]|uniref:hypothetical protein n=1 Tax=Bernardetia sp. OM2101 TaxID=3344876 RepID=UPI0035D0B61D